jgi:hypothetical protein
MIGVDLSGLSGSTQLFAQGTPAFGSGGSEWQYIEATATFITGEIVLINPNGTAKTLITSLLTAGTEGYEVGFVQNLVNQGEFAWVARRGRGLYVLVTGTLTAGSDNGLAVGANSGRLVAGTNGGNSMFGIWLTQSVSGGASAVTAVMQWPRIIASAANGAVV